MATSPFIILGVVTLGIALLAVFFERWFRRSSRNRDQVSRPPAAVTPSAPLENTQDEEEVEASAPAAPFASHVILNLKPILPRKAAYDDLASFKVHDSLAETPCAICLEPFGDADVTAGNCLHKFHTVCIKSWLKKDENHSCPVCRESFLDEEEVDAVDATRPGPSAPALLSTDGFRLSLEIPPTPSTPPTPLSPLSPRSISPGTSSEYRIALGYFEHPAMPPLVFPQSRHYPHYPIHPCMHPVRRVHGPPPMLLHVRGEAPSRWR